MPVKGAKSNELENINETRFTYSDMLAIVWLQTLQKNRIFHFERMKGQDTPTNAQMNELLFIREKSLTGG